MKYLVLTSLSIILMAIYSISYAQDKAKEAIAYIDYSEISNSYNPWRNANDNYLEKLAKISQLFEQENKRADSIFYEKEVYASNLQEISSKQKKTLQAAQQKRLNNYRNKIAEIRVLHQQKTAVFEQKMVKAIEEVKNEAGYDQVLPISDDQDIRTNITQQVLQKMNL